MDRVFIAAQELARQGFGRYRIASHLGCSEKMARNAINSVRGEGYESPFTQEPEPFEEAETPDDVLARLHKAPGGVPLAELADASEALGELERRGFTLALVAGRVRLEKSPEARVSDDAVRGMFDPTRRVHRFAVISDTHFGGYQAQPAFVSAIIEEAARRGCSFVAHSGDHVDGPPAMHKGFEYELGLTQADDQVDFAVSVYAQSQVPILSITGNHDGSFFKASGLDVGRLIQERCEQFTHIGPIQGWIAGPNDDDAFIRLFHPGDGCSYALSYKDQKTAEFLALSNDKAPNGFHFTGHYHKQNQMRGPNGARYFLVPAACATTPFMKAKRLVNQAGAYFIEFTLDRFGYVDRCIVEDVVLAPSEWTRCDYSKAKRKQVKLITPSVWAA